MDRKTSLAALALVGAVATVVLATVLAGPATAATPPNTSPYYNNTNHSVNNETWLGNSSEPTLDSVVHLLTRIGTFVIAGGESGAVGTVLTGILVFAAVVGAVGPSQPGAVGGAVLGIATIAGLSVSGLVAPWVWGLVVLAVALVCVTVVIRLLR